MLGVVLVEVERCEDDRLYSRIGEVEGISVWLMNQEKPGVVEPL